MQDALLEKIAKLEGLEIDLTSTVVQLNVCGTFLAFLRFREFAPGKAVFFSDAQ